MKNVYKFTRFTKNTGFMGFHCDLKDDNKGAILIQFVDKEVYGEVMCANYNLVNIILFRFIFIVKQ